MAQPELKVPSKGEEERTINIIVDDEILGAIFSDLVLFHANTDGVILTFLQKLPPDFSKPETEEEVAKVQVRVAMTWPHFYRFARAVNSGAKDNKERVVAALDKNIREYVEHGVEVTATDNQDREKPR